MKRAFTYFGMGIFVMMVISSLSCQKDENINILTLDTDVPTRMKVGEKDTLIFNININEPYFYVTKIMMYENTDYYSIYNPGEGGDKRQKMEIKTLYCPAQTGSNKLTILISLKRGDQYILRNYRYSFIIQVE